VGITRICETELDSEAGGGRGTLESEHLSCGILNRSFDLPDVFGSQRLNCTGVLATECRPLAVFIPQEAGTGFVQKSSQDGATSTWQLACGVSLFRDHEHSSLLAQASIQRQ
jgi:hypothetical protein